MITKAERAVRVEDLEPGDLAVLGEQLIQVESVSKSAEGVVVAGPKASGNAKARATKHVVNRGEVVTVVAPGHVLDAIEQTIVGYLAAYDSPIGSVPGSLQRPQDGDSHLLVKLDDSSAEWSVPLRSRARPVAEASASMDTSAVPQQELVTQT